MRRDNIRFRRKGYIDPPRWKRTVQNEMKAGFQVYGLGRYTAKRCLTRLQQQLPKQKDQKEEQAKE